VTAETAEATNKELLRKSFAAWGDGTGSPYDLLADDAVWTIVGQSAASRTYHGREDFLANVIRGDRVLRQHFVQRVMDARLAPVIRQRAWSRFLAHSSSPVMGDDWRPTA
jgi:ketosteroid isomerase-like protein